MTRSGGTRWCTLPGIVLLGGLLLAPAVAHAATAPPPPSAPEQGSYLRLDAEPGDFLLSPGDSAQWRVGVDLVDPPSPGEIALRIAADGSLTDVPGAMVLSMAWCNTPVSCDAGATVLPPTPAEDLPDAPLDLDGLSTGWLLVTATVPDDAPNAAQGRELRVAVDGHAQGDDLPTDPPPTGPPPTAGPTPTPTTSAPAAPPTGSATPPPELTVTGAPLLAPALIAAASVLVGAGLAGARRLAHRRQQHTESH